jgi:hypothetical protein
MFDTPDLLGLAVLQNQYLVRFEGGVIVATSVGSNDW